MINDTTISEEDREFIIDQLFQKEKLNSLKDQIRMTFNT